MNFLKGLKADRITFVGIGLWVVGIVLVGVAGVGLQENFEAAGNALDGRSKPEVQVSITRDVLTEDHYRTAEAVLSKLFPALTIEASKEKIKIEASDEAQWKEWLNALAYLPLVHKQALWEVVEMCAGVQCGATPYSAIVVGAEQNIKTSDLVGE